MLRSGLALRGQIQVVEEGISWGKQPGRGNQNESGVRKAFMHMAARPGMVKHDWGEKGAPQRGMGVRAQEGEGHVQAQGP